MFGSPMLPPSNELVLPQGPALDIDLAKISETYVHKGSRAWQNTMDFFCLVLIDSIINLDIGSGVKMHSEYI